jgi:hypothetical protein
MPVNPGFAQLGRDSYLRPSTVVGETFSRLGHVNTAFTLASGTVQETAMYLPAGLTIGHLAACTDGAGINGPTHWWFRLSDSSLNQLAVTADQGSTAWALNTYKSLAVATIASGASAVFTTTYDGLYYFGINATWSGSGPSIMGVAQTGIGLTSQAPVLCGTSDAGQTTPPAFPHTATSITAGANPLYCAAAA